MRCMRVTEIDSDATELGEGALGEIYFESWRYGVSRTEHIGPGPDPEPVSLNVPVPQR